MSITLLRNRQWTTQKLLNDFGNEVLNDFVEQGVDVLMIYFVNKVCVSIC